MKLLSVEIAGILWLLVFVYSCFKGWRKHQLRLSIKSTVNGMRWFVHFVGVVYFIVLVMMPLPIISEWSIAQGNEAADELASLLLRGVPFVYMAFAWIIVAWVMWKSVKPWIKYTDAEQKIRAEEKKEWRRRIGWFSRVWR